MKSLVKAGSGAALLLALQPGMAAPPAPPADSAQAVKDLAACRAIAAPAERLACYDRTAAALEAAIDRKEVVVVDKQEMARTRRSLFGFTLPRFGPFKAQEQESEIISTITFARSIGFGRWHIGIDGGAVWETLEGNDANGTPKVGQKIVIKRGTLGSYFLRVGNDRAVTARRVS